jgi:hypothetical protein
MTKVIGPLISCICVTENRPAFMPWLLWNFDRQRWPDRRCRSKRELVIVDSSPEPFRAAGRDDVRVVTAPPGTGVARKRNLGLQEARGEIVAWFDDDPISFHSDASLDCRSGTEIRRARAVI